MKHELSMNKHNIIYKALFNTLFLNKVLYKASYCAVSIKCYRLFVFLFVSLVLWLGNTLITMTITMKHYTRIHLTRVNALERAVTKV